MKKESNEKLYKRGKYCLIIGLSLYIIATILEILIGKL